MAMAMARVTATVAAVAAAAGQWPAAPMMKVATKKATRTKASPALERAVLC